MARILIVGTGTGIGKTHVTCALIRAARLRGLDAVGLKPIETGVGVPGELGDQERLTMAAGGGSFEREAFHVKHSVAPPAEHGAIGGPGPEEIGSIHQHAVRTSHGPNDQQPIAVRAAIDELTLTPREGSAHQQPIAMLGRITGDRAIPTHDGETDHGRPVAAGRGLADAEPVAFGQCPANPPDGAVSQGTGQRQGRPVLDPPTEQQLAAVHGAPSGQPPFHVKPSTAPRPEPRDHEATAAAAPCPDAPPTRPLYEFPDPISPHLAALRAGVRFDLGAMRRWVTERERQLTFVETAGGLFSPLDAATSNFDLVNALRPALVVVVAPDRLGVLHEVTATVGLAAARGRPVDAVILSAPDRPDASTETNAESLTSLGIARPIACFPRMDDGDAGSLAAANLALDRLFELARVRAT